MREKTLKKKASHRGHGGHREGIGVKVFWETSGLLCEKDAKEEARTEVTEGGLRVKGLW